jgi:hypothetical protein
MNPPPSHIRNWKNAHLLLLALLALLCFWPLSLGIFSAKNDNLVQFLPVRFHISEALRNGHLPLWSPYLYLGYPIHGDMQGGAWSPVVWLLSLFGRYNVSSIHAEILIYTFLSGAGMYRLLSSLGLKPSTRLAGAAAFMMCGYITDVAGSNLPFLAAPAYIPFVLAFYYELLIKPSAGSAFKTGIALSLLFVSAYPSFFICTAYIMLAAFITYVPVKKIWRHKEIFKRQVSTQFLMAMAFLTLAAPAILSYLQILPHYQRGSGVSLVNALQNSLDPFCSWSFIFPSVPIKNPSIISTDLISRNSYFNLLFLLSIPILFRLKKTLLVYFTLLGIIYFFLFSLGDVTPVRRLSYHLLPLMDTFRHPSNARLFVILGGIILGVLVLDKIVIGIIPEKWILLPLAAGFLAILITLIIFFTRVDLSLHFFSFNMERNALKQFFDTMGMEDLFVLNGVVQLVFIGIFLVLVFKKHFGMIIPLVVINSLLMAQMTTPFTLASRISPSELNRILHEFPKDYPAPDPDLSIADASKNSLEHVNTIGISGFYNKKISLPEVQFTPTFMSAIEKYMANKPLHDSLSQLPYAFFTKPGTGKFQLKDFYNNVFHFQTETTQPSGFCLQQLNLPGWKVYLDGNRTSVQKISHPFLQVSLPEGVHELRFVYEPGGIVSSLVISLISLLFMILFFVKTRAFGKK